MNRIQARDLHGERRRESAVWTREGADAEPVSLANPNGAFRDCGCHPLPGNKKL